MLSRRHFLGALAAPVAAVATAPLCAPGSAAAALAARPRGPLAAPDPAANLATDEDFWFDVAQAFTVDRSLVNLNNGGVSPAPAVVQEAMGRHLAFSNQAPAYTMWRVLEPQREAVRERLARVFGCDPEELAVTRNASEGLQTCQFGFDLARGDEVLTTNQDYPRMINTFKQRERREGIVLRQFSIPVPAEDDDEIVALFEQHITPRTKLILVSHMINLTGQILPVAKVVAMARTHGIPVIVDGAHALAHFDFKLSDLDCDYYATSLHKWLFAPHGTGLLYIHKSLVPNVWPLMAAPEKRRHDIRKFEEIGTHPVAQILASAEALTFHQALGGKRKEQRLIHLRNYWCERLLKHDRVHLNTSLKPGFACGIANARVDGLDTGKLNAWLWNERRILTVGIKHDEVDGLRVSPSAYTTHEELDRFCDAVEHAMKHGLPE